MLIEEGGTSAPEGMAMVQDQIAAVAQQSVQIQGAAKNLAASAGTGFHIEPGAAATLIESCIKAHNQLSDVQAAVQAVGLQPKLGQTPGAKVVAPFTQQTATEKDGIQSAITNLMQTLDDMRAAYQKASTNYEQTEQLVQTWLKHLNPGKLA